jgi:hypothetical protein
MEQNKFQMTMKEEWVRWEPIEGLTGKYDIKSLCTDTNSLIITLYSCTSKEKHKIEFKFTSFVNAYRETNESFRINLFHELSKKYAGNFYGDWTFFKVVNSEYIAWLIQDSCAHAALKMIHFCLMGYDSVVDIITCHTPLVRIIKLPNNK